jgi:hypothetical protein
MNHLLLIAHAASTWFMVGLIWFVQIVHYPLFAMVGASSFMAYERRHQTLTTLVVGPVMLAEFLAAAVIAAQSLGWLDAKLGTRPIVPTPLALSGAALLAIVWLSTWAVQVPLHAKLEAGGGLEVMRWLVLTNWVRTICWSLRGVAAAIMLVPQA